MKKIWYKIEKTKPNSAVEECCRCEENEAIVINSEKIQTFIPIFRCQVFPFGRFRDDSVKFTDYKFKMAA